ncbi:hypothetical protein PHBOTO_004205 [Pseudozyma hubeiensis]|nr:hypothetical protein PHBOTO_004205 [Pseudozyma hubeiensis]
MDAWSSPWGDDPVQPVASTSKRVDTDAISALEPSSRPPAFSSLNSFDASDPWSTDVATPAAESNPLPDAETSAPIDDQVSVAADEATFSSSPYVSASWGDASSVPVVKTDDAPSPTQAAGPPSDHDEQSPTAPSRQQSLSSYDPWAADSTSTGWDDQPRFASSTTLPSDPEPQSTAWGASEFSTPLPDRLKRDDATTQGAETDDQQQTGARGNLDVWAAEASSRDQKARHLNREEIDRLKLDARKLISSVNTEERTQASFADPSIGEAAWTDLFGSQGTQREKLHRLQSPPSSLISSNGALRLHGPHPTPATSDRLRSSIANTEYRGVKLTSLDNTSSWQRGSRPLTKADWLPDHMAGEIDGLSLSSTNINTEAATPGTMSGPGWVQTSSNENRSTSGPSFLSSFFKGRQPSAAAAAATTSQEKESRSSTSSFEAAARVSTSAQFEPYQDNTASRYTDDPSGPDLMSLQTAAASQPVPPPSVASVVIPAQGPGLLSRWRNSGLFKSTAKKQNPSWASSSLRADDLDWLEEQESNDSRIGRYHYDDEADAEDSFASFQNSATRPASPPARNVVSTAAKAVDPFDNLFGPAVQTSLNSGPGASATSSARSSLSAGRMSGEGGMMTINTNLARANSLARKNAASPLQPPPQAQNKRLSFAPPPRANAASPMLANPASASNQRPAQTISDPFADFLSDAPSQQSSGPNASKIPKAPTKPSAPSANGKGGGLTADDLLFFDSL